VGGSGFRLSAGAVVNDNEVSGTGQGVPGTLLEIGDALFPAEEVGRLEAEVTFDDVVPYLGIGWGNAVADGGGLGISLDIGVLFQGEPEADFRAVGANPLIADLLDQEIAAEEQEIQDDLDQFQYYPVISLGLSYKF
jgi:hypothetical protein